MFIDGFAVPPVAAGRRPVLVLACLVFFFLAALPGHADESELTFDAGQDRAGKECRVPFLQSTRRAAPREKVPDTFLPPLAKRQWRDDTGKHEVTASLVGYCDGHVRLRVESGDVIDVPLSKLSTTDLVYVSRQRRMATRGSRESLVTRAVLGGASPSDLTVHDRDGRSERLFGVDWYSADDAKKIASREKKPVMWFRVLGDLSGFM